MQPHPALHFYKAITDLAQTAMVFQETEHMLGKGNGRLFGILAKEESERQRGEEGDEIKFVDLRFERGQLVGLSELC